MTEPEDSYAIMILILSSPIADILAAEIVHSQKKYEYPKNDSTF